MLNAAGQSRRQHLNTGAALGLSWVAHPFFIGAALLPSGAAASANSPPTEAYAAALRRTVQTSGAVLMLRHAQTEPGVGDPAGFRLGECSTQRNLSEAGRAQAQRAGEWLQAHQLKPTALKTSQWCRCQDTARLIGARVGLAATDWPALNSFFDNRAAEPAQSAELRATLKTVKPGQLLVWVTHQVNLTALTGEVPAMGEGFVLAGGRGHGDNADAAHLKIALRLRFA